MFALKDLVMVVVVGAGLLFIDQYSETRVPHIRSEQSQVLSETAPVLRMKNSAFR